VHRGHEGVRAFLAELAEAAEFGAQATEFIDTADWVVVCLRLHGRGKASGAEFEEREVHASRLRDGKVVETHEYRTKEQALQAVGLRE
jgi:ketosteroid isomerase-like protein